MADAGYDVARVAWLLADVPVTLIGRCRSDRVFYAPAGVRRGPTKGRPPRHGAKLVLREPGTHPEATAATANDTAGYGRVEAVAFARMHPRPESRGGWAEHIGALPIIEGTVVGLRVERLPGDHDPRPLRPHLGALAGRRASAQPQAQGGPRRPVTGGAFPRLATLPGPSVVATMTRKHPVVDNRGCPDER